MAYWSKLVDQIGAVLFLFFVKFVLTKSTVMEILVWIGYLLMFLIAIAILIAVVLGILFYGAAIIGGVLTLIDKFKSDTDSL